MKVFSFFYLSIAVFQFVACNQTEKNIVNTPIADKKRHRANYDRAILLMPINRDSAFHYFNNIATESKDSLLIATAYTHMGMIQFQASDYFGSQESLLQSLNHLDENNSKHYQNLVSIYTELGNDSRGLKNFEEAITYFKLGLNFSKDSADILLLLNNIAAVNKDKKQYDSAIGIYTSILKNPKNSPLEYARILSNLAYVRWLQNSNYDAIPELWTALNIRKGENDKWGLSASYIHLTDYYTLNRPDSALFYAHQLYNVTREIGSPDEVLNALSKLVPLSRLNETKQYFEKYQILGDSIETSRNRAKNQFALIRYNAEKHKTDKLKLQKENAETKLRVIWLQVSSVILVLAAITGFIWYRRRKRQAIKEQQLRISQKVHDVVANGLYRVMSKIEHDKAESKEQLLDEMGVLYEQSRNISYEQPEIIYGDFQQTIISLLQSFANDTTTVSIVGDSKELWDSLTAKIKKDLPLILQNLMTNMKRHSRAESVVVRFGLQKKQFSIHYTDDGIGLPPNFKFGKGLTNTEFRIHSLGGQLTFDNSATKGAKINIYIPTAN
jgi:signal transduction histidine kinase